jgi:hypothetical protein
MENPSYRWFGKRPVYATPGKQFRYELRGSGYERMESWTFEGGLAHASKYLEDGGDDGDSGDAHGRSSGMRQSRGSFFCFLPERLARSQESRCQV